ncbi:MAG: hypothetical protein G01um101433_608 [Parcubacteria group bacterium Gr01-1014_33]|nr:MAG: hypothetical protein G01um101433_608 [Parcubacteria group bacterium Gr01-1014_33]
MKMEKRFEKIVEDIPNLSEYIAEKLGFSKKEKDAADAVFWLIYKIELDLKEIAFTATTNKVRESERQTVINFVEITFSELTFGQKIKVIEKNSKKDGSFKSVKEFFKIANKFNDIRNQIFHQRQSIKEVCYDGKKIIERQTQNKMIVDFNLSFNGDNDH